ncbi:MAG: 2-oxo acid dehydrogenase subunit E2 [Legionellaceae bacterium]|nr:2-oxo acid dehydrogenase subunit E2 [Legionellaceae bacterium]
MTVLEKILVPDIGGVADVDVIELLVKVGDHIEKDTPLVTLESDKATMEIPSPVAGEVSALNLKLGDKVSEGDLILTYAPSASGEKPKKEAKKEDTPEVLTKKEEETPKDPQEEPVKTAQQVKPEVSELSLDDDEPVLAGPSARRLAHKLGVSLSDVQGSGRKSRISKEDIEEFVKVRLNQPVATVGLSLAQPKQIDFSRFGEIETKPLNKIKKLTGSSVHYSWSTIPHVTQFDTADITDLENFRKSEQPKAKDKGYKLTILAFVCKVVAKALEVFPQFNSSLNPTADSIIYKKYYNLGIAVETPNGLVVPVVNNVDKLSVGDVALEMGRLSAKARDKGLMPADMSGGSFTISSLGGIGGHAFTPIVNSPEVAILGLSKASIQPIYQNGEFVPRLILPISLSYDHRVIDGAEAARFARYICEGLSDLRRIML